MSTETELLRAKLAELEAAEAFVAAKQSEKRNSAKYLKAKAALREARLAHRTLRESVE